MQLHDDDYLLPGAGEAMLEAIRRAGSSEAMLLFGVQIVDLDGRPRREQRFRRERYLEPQQALRRLWPTPPSCASPPPSGAAQQWTRRAYSTPPSAAPTTPICGCGRSRYGVRCLPQTTCAYTIHEAAATTGMWNPGTIRASAEMFDRAVAQGVVPTHHPTLAGRLVPPVHLGRRPPAAAARATGRGARGASTI